MVSGGLKLLIMGCFAPSESAWNAASKKKGAQKIHGFAPAKNMKKRGVFFLPTRVQNRP